MNFKGLSSRGFDLPTQMEVDVWAAEQEEFVLNAIMPGVTWSRESTINGRTLHVVIHRESEDQLITGIFEGSWESSSHL